MSEGETDPQTEREARVEAMLRRCLLRPPGGMSHDMRNPHEVENFECTDEYCMYCRYYVEVCAECGGSELTLTTHCPMEQITSNTGKRILSGKLDYRGRLWTEL
ncbi:hypothetical protein AB0F25_30625 [Streptomyces wedmorensis]|uniref:hypothetical protein n=1 Tax=Streptomyces wedmorensis TaxID=43759 RepID=UPI003427ED9B